MSNATYNRKLVKRGPWMRVTSYDRASALVLAVVAGLVITVLWLFALWAGQHNWRDDRAVPLEMVIIGGGEEDGEPDETLDLKTPFDETADPSQVDTPEELTEVEPTLDSVVDLAEQATDMAQQAQTDAVQTSGNPGSRTGTGRPALGMGSGEAGLSREQRWFVSFAEGGSASLYARQLDYFGIELGALVPGGRLAYLSNLAAPQPTVRYVNSGAGEKRLYMTWQGGGRRKADIELLRKANVDPGAGATFHFYPPEIEEQLAKLEYEYQKRPAKDIRRTYFTVQPSGAGYRFIVTRQAYLR